MWICLSRLTSTLSVSELYIAKIILIISRSFRVAMFCKYAHHIFHACSICTTKVYKQSHILEKSWNAWSSPAYNTNATLLSTNPLFQGFSRSQNVSQNHNVTEKVFYTPGLMSWGVFL